MVFNVIEIEYILKKKTHALYSLFYSNFFFYFVMQNLWLINIVRDIAKLDEYAIRLKNWTTLNPRNRISYRYKLSSRLNQRNQIDKMLSTGLFLLLITSGDYLTVSARHYTLSDRLEIDVRSPVFSKSE